MVNKENHLFHEILQGVNRYSSGEDYMVCVIYMLTIIIIIIIIIIINEVLTKVKLSLKAPPEKL